MKQTPCVFEAEPGGGCPRSLLCGFRACVVQRQDLRTSQELSWLCPKFLESEEDALPQVNPLIHLADYCLPTWHIVALQSCRQRCHGYLEMLRIEPGAFCMQNSCSSTRDGRRHHLPLAPMLIAYNTASVPLQFTFCQKPCCLSCCPLWQNYLVYVI